MLSPRRTGRGLLARLVARALIVALLVGLLPSPAQASLLPAPNPKLPDLPLDEGRSVFALVVLAEGMPCAVLLVLSDPHLSSKYHRARWMDPRTGRFTGMDPFRGSAKRPISLHKYLYAGATPANSIDPTGLNEFSLAGMAVTLSVLSTVALNGLTTYTALSNPAVVEGKMDAFLLSGRFAINSVGGTLGYGLDAVYMFNTNRWYVAQTLEGGIAPVSVFGPQRGVGGTFVGGFVFGLNNPGELSGRGVAAAWPLSVIHLLPGTLFSGNKAWGMLTQLAKRTKGGSGAIAQFGVSTSGPSYFQVGVRNNSFTSTVSDTGDFIPVDQAPDAVKQLFEPVAASVSGVLPLGKSVEALTNGADKYVSTMLALGQ
jgi:RHS repeat-associated protein